MINYSKIFDELFLLNRSLLGEGYLKSLKIINRYIKLKFLKLIMQILRQKIMHLLTKKIPWAQYMQLETQEMSLILCQIIMV